MSAYYAIVNHTKRERVEPNAVPPGRTKLSEIVRAPTHAGLLAWLCAEPLPHTPTNQGRWSGDSVALLGDDISEDRVEECRATYRDITEEIAREWLAFAGEIDEWDLGVEEWNEIASTLAQQVRSGDLRALKVGLANAQRDGLLESRAEVLRLRELLAEVAQHAQAWSGPEGEKLRTLVRRRAPKEPGGEAALLGSNEPE